LKKEQIGTLFVLVGAPEGGFRGGGGGGRGGHPKKYMCLPKKQPPGSGMDLFVAG